MRSIRIYKSRGVQISQKYRKLQFFENVHSTSLICSTLPCPRLCPMNFLECLVVSQTCIWYRTRTTQNLSQNELMKLELCPNNRPKIINSFGPTLSHLARWLPKSRAWYKVTLRDKLYESLATRGKPSTLFPRERLVELVVTTNQSTTHVATPIARAHR